jgi:FAD/FMN-containing dehydrogenase
MRECAAEVSFGRKPLVVTDVAVPLDLVERFLDQAGQAVAALDPQAQPIYVAHLGDGNLHYTLWPSRADADLQEALLEAIEEVVRALGGSFSAEHGIGTSKLSSMQRRKDPVALEMMRAIKQALDPKGILNPGKVIP